MCRTFPTFVRRWKNKQIQEDGSPAPAHSSGRRLSDPDLSAAVPAPLGSLGTSSWPSQPTVPCRFAWVSLSRLDLNLHFLQPPQA